MGKAHQSIAAQMKSELEEPLGAFAGGLKERRKIVQSGIEKLLKVKVQQTQVVNKVRFKTSGCDWKTKTITVARPLRARLSEDQGLPCAGTHGHGPRREEKQGKIRKDADPISDYKQ